MPAKELWVAGYPSRFGGADTELDHNIDLWRRQGVEVHLVPMFSCDPAIQALCNARGCVTHQYQPDIFREKVVASFCNGDFLAMLPDIIQSGRPRSVIWFNCMTWTFPAEIVAHRNGWIDHHGFVSNYQRSVLKPQLEVHRPVVELEGYKPYFSLDNTSQEIQFRYAPPTSFYAVGRISRDDSTKFSDDMWDIFHKVCAPIPKKVFVLGYGVNAHARCGSAPPRLDWQTWEPNGVPVKQLYGLLHAIIHKTGGSRESYCRIVPEAYAAGVPMIVENDFAFPDLIEDGVTGYLCRSSDEMSFRASELAFDEERRKRLIDSARERLINDISSPSECWKAWRAVLT